MFYAVRARETHAETVLTFLAPSACAAFPWMFWTLEKKNERIVLLWRLRCFYIWPANAHCSEHSLSLGRPSWSTWEQGQDGEIVASQAIENALVPPPTPHWSGAIIQSWRRRAQTTSAGLFRVSPDTILRLAAEWERAQIMTEGGRLRIVPVSLGSNGHKCKVWQLGVTFAFAMVTTSIIRPHKG